MPSISVVIPVYNAETILPELVDQLSAVVPGLAAEYELVLVNDGSTDDSWAAIRRLIADNAWIRGINLMRNYGQHNALLCGIRAARHDVVVSMDDDLQHPPEEIPRLLDRLAEGYDVVYGTPNREQHGLWRDLASRITKLALQNTMGAEIARNVSAFRAFRAQLRDAFAGYRSPFVSVDVLLTWGTSRFSAVTVRHDHRLKGESSYTLRKLLTHALNMMTGFSTLPLQMASVTGFVFTAFGIAMLLFVVGRYFLEGGAPPGFPFLVSLIAVLAGAQLFALGIIGEYLARMHFRTLEKPPYVVREATASRHMSEKVASHER